MTDRRTIADLLWTFNRQLEAWLDAGGDERLRDFTPLSAWHDVVARLAAVDLDRDKATLQ